MSKTIIVKLTRAGAIAGPFTITDNFRNVIATDVPKKTLIKGTTFIVDNNVTILYLESTGTCNIKKAFRLESYTVSDFANAVFIQTTTACLWRHLTNIQLYNSYYGITQPYIIEYPFALALAVHIATRALHLPTGEIVFPFALTQACLVHYSITYHRTVHIHLR